LKIDTSELPILAAYRLQVVDATGHEIWAGSASGVQQQIRVAIPGPLRSGQYWIRLFGQDKTQLREFGLEVQ
jgi:hypothetical protein